MVTNYPGRALSQSESSDRLVANDVFVDNGVTIFEFDTTIPARFRVKDDSHAACTLIEAGRPTDAHLLFEPAVSDQLFEAIEHRFRSLGYATAAGIVGRAPILADKDMLAITNHHTMKPR